MMTAAEANKVAIQRVIEAEREATQALVESIERRARDGKRNMETGPLSAHALTTLRELGYRVTEIRHMQGHELDDYEDRVYRGSTFYINWENAQPV